MIHDDEKFDEFEPASKSELKREMHRLQALGKKLLTLKEGQLKEFPISEEMHRAIQESRRIKSNEAQRRHLQYIGKLMRNEDQPGIQHALDLLDPSSDISVRAQKQAELWRHRLVFDPAAENEWFTHFPTTDRQQFRALIRATRKEQSPEQDTISKGKNATKLLHWIKSQLSD